MDVTIHFYRLSDTPLPFENVSVDALLSLTKLKFKRQTWDLSETTVNSELYQTWTVDMIYIFLLNLCLRITTLNTHLISYPNKRDSRASSFVCRTMCLWRKYHTWHTPCRRRRQHSVQQHLAKHHQVEKLLVKSKHPRTQWITPADLLWVCEWNMS